MKQEEMIILWTFSTWFGVVEYSSFSLQQMLIWYP